MYMLADPGPGCHYTWGTNADGCPAPTGTICEVKPVCPVFVLADPGPGCHYTYGTDAKGCSTVTGTVCDEPEPHSCMEYDLAAPPRGCHYVFERDEHGCNVYKGLECKETRQDKREKAKKILREFLKRHSR